MTVMYTIIGRLIQCTLKLANAGLQRAAKIYFINLALCITTNLYENEVSLLFIALHADNSLPFRTLCVM